MGGECGSFQVGTLRRCYFPPYTMERAGGESGEGSWKIFNQRTLAHPPLPIPIGATKGAAETPEKIAPFLLPSTTINPGQESGGPF